MKKTVSVLLALCMILALGALFTSCNEECDHVWDAGSVTKAASATEEGEKTFTCTVCQATKAEPFAYIGQMNAIEWIAATAVDSFNNVTVSISGNFVSGYTDNQSFAYTYKLDGSRAGSDGSMLDGEATAAIHNMYIQTAHIMLHSNYDKFTYDATNQVYTATEALGYTVNVLGYVADITVENAVVCFDQNGNVTSITGVMTQSFLENGTPKSYVLNVAFAFSDYGTTVL